jgi:hypothetical protein
MTQHAYARQVALDRGDVLRIRDGAGTTVRAQSGVLWVTEECDHDDRVLGPGVSCRIAHAGIALVEAHRPARLVIEVPPGVDGPRDVRILFRGGEESQAVRFAKPRRALATLATRAKALWRGFARVLRRASDKYMSVPVGGHYEHDRFLSSRRPRGDLSRLPVVERFVPDRYRFPYY